VVQCLLAVIGHEADRPRETTWPHHMVLSALRRRLRRPRSAAGVTLNTDEYPGSFGFARECASYPRGKRACKTAPALAHRGIRADPAGARR